MSVSKQQPSLKINKFSLWLRENGIKQVVLKNATQLAIGTIHKMMKYGEATPKTIKLVAISLRDTFKLEITEEEISEMLKQTE